MNIRLPLVLALALACGSGLATHAAPALGASPPNLGVVGLWRLDTTIGPCDAPMVRRQFLVLQTFHLGGTVTGSDIHPASGQGATQGLWSYNWRTGRYAVRMLFPRFVNDAFDGMQDIAITNIRLSARGEAMTGDVHAYMRNPDGSVRLDICGSVSGERVHIDR